jgi:hypothetical protein
VHSVARWLWSNLDQYPTQTQANTSPAVHAVDVLMVKVELVSTHVISGVNDAVVLSRTKQLTVVRLKATPNVTTPVVADPPVPTVTFPAESDPAMAGEVPNPDVIVGAVAPYDDKFWKYASGLDSSLNAKADTPAACIPLEAMGIVYGVAVALS